MLPADLPVAICERVPQRDVDAAIGQSRGDEAPDVELSIRGARGELKDEDLSPGKSACLLQHINVDFGDIGMPIFFARAGIHRSPRGRICSQTSSFDNLTFKQRAPGWLGASTMRRRFAASVLWR